MDQTELKVEFCSLEHFLELQTNMARRLEVARELYPKWFVQP
jgi:hypothetical protein